MFAAINYLLFEKNKTELDDELLEEFNPYMVSRYLSFCNSGALSDYTNETLNMYGNLFKTKEEQFLFYENIIPKLKRQKITYFKKKVKEKTDKKIPVEEIPDFYSKKEINKLTSKM